VYDQIAAVINRAARRGGGKDAVAEGFKGIEKPNFSPNPFILGNF